MLICSLCDKEFETEDGGAWLDNTPPDGFAICEDCITWLDQIVVNVYGPGFYDGWDVWWKVEYEEFIKDHPDANIKSAPASDDLDAVYACLELTGDKNDDGTSIFNIWSKGLISIKEEE